MVLGTLEKRFYKKIEKTDYCWVWLGAKTGSGYGVVRGPDSRMMGAHVASYLIHNGPIEVGQQICHICDNKLCVNPNHLFIGTQLDNMHDMISKGRQATGEKLNHPSQKGELNSGSKLTEDQVIKEKKLYSEGYRQCEIMRLLGITRANIWAIVHGVSWNHV